jgi:hypothetical protein
LLLCH